VPADRRTLSSIRVVERVQPPRRSRVLATPAADAIRS
jgi:hypothetical protein